MSATVHGGRRLTVENGDLRPDRGPHVEECPGTCETDAVPLSDDEQRILRQIEEQLQTDQRFAQLASPAGLYRQSARSVRWAILGVVLGLVITVVALQIHFLLAFVGFLVMLGCALVIERQLRAIGKVGVADIAATLRNSKIASARIRDRFPRD